MSFSFCFKTAAQTVQTTAVQPLNHGGEFSDLTELSHADLNGLVSEIEGEDEIFKQFGNFELDNIFAEFDEKVKKLKPVLPIIQVIGLNQQLEINRLEIVLRCSATLQRRMIFLEKG